MASKPPPAPTLLELQRSSRWFWADCNNPRCNHRRPLPVAPFIIRWGADVSSDDLRRNLTCSKCGHRGAATMLPSWVDMQTGWQSFPSDWTGA